jgi:hypothetical protein
MTFVQGYQAEKPREEVRSAVECLVNGSVSLGMLGRDARTPRPLEPSYCPPAFGM